MKRYKLERKMEWSAIGISLLLLFIFVPRNRVREAHNIFLFKQAVAWLFGLIVVEKKLIKYPSRILFRNALKSSFTFEYFVYPAHCVLFNMKFPEKNNYLVKFLYYFIHISIITGLEVFALKYTNVIRYTNWKWYWSFITLWFTNYLSRIYHKWYMQKTSYE